MPKSGMNGSGRSAGTGTSLYYGPVLIILALLVGWLVVTNWDQLPQLPHAIANAVATLA